jgi:hypothetical protein
MARVYTDFMNKKLLSFPTVLTFLFLATPSLVRAEIIDPYAYCQVKLLKVATDGLFQEFIDKGQHVAEIREVVYNYNLKGRPRVVFVSSHLRDFDEVCIMTVTTTETAQANGPCPDYQLQEVRTTCN